MNRLFLTVLLMLFSIIALAQVDTDCSFDMTSEDYAKTFPLSTEQGKMAYKWICEVEKEGKKVDLDTLNDIFNTFHAVLRQEATAILPSIYYDFRIFQEPLLAIDGTKVIGLNPQINPQFDGNTFVGLEVNASTSGGEANIARKDWLDSQAIKDCQAAVDRSCWTALQHYRNLLEKVYAPFGYGNVETSHGFITAADREWKAYIEKARSQTWLDVAISSAIYRMTIDDEVRKSTFIPPPEVQYFFLKPNIIVDNVGAAMDGDEIKEALAIEVVGFNYWQEKCLGMACGASLIATYADRNGVDDNGWGIMGHLDNRYSFGVTKYGGDTGFFITVDLLKFFQDKETNFSDYKEKVRDKLKL